ncbi:MAG: 2-phospho-L-lactate transferase [Ornithinimicrobium sp.]
MQITVLAGGVGGARFIRGLRHHLDRTGLRWDPDTGTGAQITVVGNTGDDITLYGLRVCPDLDTLLYTLGGAVHEDQGWGRAEETFLAQHELRELGVQPTWFGLGDRDMGTHLARSLWLSEGASLSEVTARLATRWGLPDRGITLLPATDEPIETHVVIADETPGAEPDAERAVHFQQWWVQLRAAVPARRFVVAGLARATAAAGVLPAIREADIVLLPPSNPVVSIGIIAGVPGVRDALRGTRAPVVGVSPIIAGAPVRGHADACLAPLGVPVTASGVAGLYADFLDGWLVDDADADASYPGARVRARDLHMRSVEQAADIAGSAMELAHDIASAQDVAR